MDKKLEQGNEKHHFYKEDFPLLPLWFFRYHSTTSNPCGFYLDRGFAKVTGCAFIRGEVFISPPCGFYTDCGFHNITRDVFIPPAVPKLHVVGVLMP